VSSNAVLRPLVLRAGGRQSKTWGLSSTKDRLMAAMDHFNRDPVVHTWTYKLNAAP